MKPQTASGVKSPRPNQLTAQAKMMTAAPGRPVAGLKTGAASPARKGGVVQPFPGGLLLGGAALLGLGYGAYRLLSSLGDTLGSGVEQGMAEAFSDDLWEQQLLGGRPEFHNHSLPNYANEVGEYQQRIGIGRPDYRPIVRINTRDFTSTQLAAFENAVYAGWNFMWTLDITDRLSIGMAGIATHAVLAEGNPVFAAGEGTAEMPQDWVEHKVHENTLAISNWYKSQGDEDGAEGWRRSAARPTTPRPREVRTHTVLLDFQSGHYTPTRAWRETLEAWQRIGFNVKKARNLLFTT